MAEVLRRTGKLEAGAYVVDGCCNCREVRDEVFSLEGDKEKRHDEYDGKGYEIHVY